MTFSAGTHNNATVNGGAGADTMTLNGATFTVSTVQSGDGHDRINATGAIFDANSIIAMGKGLDSISLSTQIAGSVAGGAGADTITITTAWAGGKIFGDGLGVTSGGTLAGADVLGYSAMEVTGAGSIYGGGGADTIKIASAAGGSFLIEGGDGADVIGNSNFLFAASAQTLSGGAGADVIKAKEFHTTTNFILGGAGNDSITLTVNTNQGSINGGAGVDLITVSGDTQSVNSKLFTINGGAGADSIVFDATCDGVVFTAQTGSVLASLTYYQGIIAYGAGDVIQIANTQMSATGANYAGAGGQVYVFTALEGAKGLTAAFLDNDTWNEGAVGVYSDGTDTALFVKALTADSASKTISYLIKGADLVTTTAGAAVNTGTANLGFTLAAYSGTEGAASSYGVNITSCDTLIST